MNNIRTPPKPKGYKSAWHAYGVIVTSKAQRTALLNHKGIWISDTEAFIYCEKCGNWTKEFHADHIHPLWLADKTEYPDCLKYWAIGNLSAICIPCHKAKTSREAANRAKITRIQNKLSGKTKPKKKIPSRPFPKARNAHKRTKVRSRQTKI
jgi:5-methylcytosine-specific restriction endonuclease McrA